MVERKERRATWQAEEPRPAARWLASPAHWRELGWYDGGARDGLILWGEVQGREVQPYRTAVGTKSGSAVCGCRSRLRPCKHMEALLLLWEEGRSIFSSAPEPLPEWVAGGFRRRSTRELLGTLPEPTLPGMEIEEAAGGSGKRVAADDRLAESWLSRGRVWEERVLSGLTVLESWLEDLWRGGIAAMGSDWEVECERLAMRMAASQASGIARWVRQMGALSVEAPDYADQLTGRVGHLALLCLAWRRVDRLRPEERIDLWVATGWPQRRRAALASPPLEDQWVHLGTSILMDGRLHRRRTWIYGQRSNRIVLLLTHSPTPFPVRGLVQEEAAADTPQRSEGLDQIPSQSVGLTFDGTVHLFPGADPQRGLLIDWRLASERPITLPRTGSVAAGLVECATALAIHPWREIFPLALRGVVPHREGDDWWLVDQEGRGLPLLDQFLVAWRLLALGGGRPLDLFGEWDGRFFRPLTTIESGRWVVLS
ncbi:MAG: hypothetical protein ACOYNR_07495 [Blastocatellia bacterium]